MEASSHAATFYTFHPQQERGPFFGRVLLPSATSEWLVAVTDAQSATEHGREWRGEDWLPVPWEAVRLEVAGALPALIEKGLAQAGASPDPRMHGADAYPQGARTGTHHLG